ncbi:hypothetical protein ACJJTC_013147 [Scirpophaga incertulas]
MQLLGKDLSPKILRTLWLDKLPIFIKNILVISEESLEKISCMADKMIEMTPPSEICQTNSVPSTSSQNSQIDKLLSKIDALEKQIESLQFSRKSRSPSRSTYRSPNRSHSRCRRYNPNGKYCFYHYKFGKRCRDDKCKPPCNWNQSGNADMQQNLR